MKRLLKLVIAAAVASVLLVPVAAVGLHDFVDVPDSNIFHSDISWLAENEVTLGCNPPANDQFCPDDNVSRGQMAAFMHRLADGQIVHAATAVTSDSALTAGTSDTALTAVQATDADDAALLEGMSVNDLKTLTFSATELALGTGVFTGLEGAVLVTLDFEVPVDGSILVTHSTSYELDTDPTAVATGATLGSCAVMGFPEYAYGAVSLGHPYGNGSGVRHLSVEAGTHTLTLCGQVESADIYVINAELGVVYEPGGVAVDLATPPVMNSTDGGPWN